MLHRCSSKKKVPAACHVSNMKVQRIKVTTSIFHQFILELVDSLLVLSGDQEVFLITDADPLLVNTHVWYLSPCAVMRS